MDGNPRPQAPRLHHQLHHLLLQRFPPLQYASPPPLLHPRLSACCLFHSGCFSADITVPANTTSYTLSSLSGNTKYDAWIVASTVRGSARGYNHSFTTQKYGEYHGPPDST